MLRAREKGAFMDASETNRKAVELQREGKFLPAIDLYKEAQALWEAGHDRNDPGIAVIAQILHNRASACRELGVFDEAERLFQLAIQIWVKRGWPKPGEMSGPDWAEAFDDRLQLKNYGKQVRALRTRVESGDADARQTLIQTLERLGPWYHNVEFARGISSNPSNRDYPMARWRILDGVIPNDLKGQSVLDIGCNSGFFSFEMKRRGAGRVMGVDIMLYLLAQSRFGSHWFDLPMDLRECGAYDVDRLEEQFDVVVFIGVLYHLKHPLYALEKVAAVCKNTMYFQSMVRGDSGEDFIPQEDYPGTELEIFKKSNFPKLYFIEKSFNGDESNWWFATHSCLKAMLRSVGFKTIENTSHPEIFVARK
jgi:tRNA (mo5U34)-methyltransferase